ncbi:MAG: thioredoxin [Candidatus Omnitrophica bacterium]|nr:thioredoxin [Candidatus Omnitrophota bacterium]
MAVTLTTENFEKEVIQSSLPVLVDFWAEWCGPCRMLSPTIDELSREYAGKLKVGKLNVDEAAEIASQYGVMSIPTLMVFDKGNVVTQNVGAQSKDKLAQIVRPYLPK